MEYNNKVGRPKCLRKVQETPEFNYFKPRGIPVTELDSIRLKVEELEAMKMVCYDGLSRVEAAEQMGISPRTLGRELNSGLVKVVDALLNGKAIEISGGYYVSEGEIVFRCLNEGHQWKADKLMGKPLECPECGSQSITKVG